MRRVGSVACTAMLCLSCVAAAANRMYVDRENGVSFSYPAEWVLNGNDDAATAKLRVALASDAVAVVALEGNFAGTGPYLDTDFEAGAFSYVVTPGGGEAACFAELAQGGDAKQTPVAAVWNGMRGERLEASYSVAGTKDSHRVVAVYRQGRCYLFETVIVSHSPDSADKPLTAERWRAIRGAFAAVMDSVRIGPAAAE